MKITVYTITDCQFSKQEKEYLTSNKLQYEEKNLETNKEFLTEMLAVSNNFAGTPVTKIEKDDGQITVLKGFTKEEFDTNLGLTTPPKQSIPVVVPQPVSQPFDNAQGKPAVADATTAVAQTNPATKAVLDQPAPTMPPPAPVKTDDLSSVTSVKEEASAKVDPLNAVLEDLQAKVNEVQPQGTVPPAPTQSPAPAISDNTASLPKIPDFQSQT